MKRLLGSAIIVLSNLLFNLCFAQSWSAMDTGVKYGGTYSGVDAMQIYNNNLFAGGSFEKAGSVFAVDIARWDGVLWDSVSLGVLFDIFSLQDYNSNLIAGGQYAYESLVLAGGHLEQWNGINWAKLGPDTSFFVKRSMYTSGILALTVYNGNLIAGGNIDSIPGMYANNIAYWNNTNWNTFGFGLTGTTSINNQVGVYALAVYNGNLYAGGYFDSAGGSPAKNIAMWNGSTWSAVGSGINNAVVTLCVYNGDLYAGGDFDSAGGNSVYNIAMWNGSSWNHVGGNMNVTGEVAALTAYNGYLYAGGSFDTIGGIAANSVAYWNGIVWHAIGTGIAEGNRLFSNDAVYEICGNNNAIYVGGSFDTAGGLPASNIAMFSAITGINEITTSSDIDVFPNPSNGLFTLSLSNISESCNIEIYNVLGGKVLTQTLRATQGDNTINLSGQPSGIYLYRVLNENGEIIGEGKIAIEK